jgi:malonyl-CoA decarboxylase
MIAMQWTRLPARAASGQHQPGLPKKLRDSLAARLGSSLGKLFERVGRSPRPATSEGLLDLAGALLSLRGKASGPALAAAFLGLYEASELPARQAFLAQFPQHHPRDKAAIDHAIAQWNERRDEAAAALLHDAAESPCQRLIRQLNLAPHGTRRLIAMRADLLSAPDFSAGLKELDGEFEHVFASWFNAGFLELRRIDWTSPAIILERLIRYEAVHSINGWDDLRRRVEPADRRCYGFFHPQMADDPLIFVEVALTAALPSAIAHVIAEDRPAIDPHLATSAIFYSISNCQPGLKGIPFGNFLIKQVVGLLRHELPQLQTFATLSPVPGLARWLEREQPGQTVPAGDALRTVAAEYLVTARDKKGQVVDPVARFHLGNGARLEAVHADADLSTKGLRQSHGVMVNYLYDLNEIEANHIALVELDSVMVSAAVKQLLRQHDEPTKSRAATAKRTTKAASAKSGAPRPER